MTAVAAMVIQNSRLGLRSHAGRRVHNQVGGAFSHSPVNAHDRLTLLEVRAPDSPEVGNWRRPNLRAGQHQFLTGSVTESGLRESGSHPETGSKRLPVLEAGLALSLFLFVDLPRDPILR